MKIIFSRKGFDDAYGGAANLILPDGRLVVFPIPERPPFQGIPYSEITSHGSVLTSYFQQLQIVLPSDHGGAHLDPDLSRESLERDQGWRPVFGSHSAANSHLKKEGVGEGDLFLFFGTFRHTYYSDEGKLRYAAIPPIHMIFGWLRVGTRIDLDRCGSIPDWVHYHPHVVNNFNNSNSLYLSGVCDDGRPDAGLLDYNEERVLTRGGYRKSQWWLPHYFHPDFGTQISRHKNHTRYHTRQGRIMLDTVSIGQDFVVKSQDRRVIEWGLSRIDTI